MILTLYGDNRQLSRTPNGADLGVSDLPAALIQLRRAYCDHRAIASIGEIEVIASIGAEHAVIPVEESLASFLHDMGNSSLDCWIGAKHAIQNMAAMQHEPKNDSITGVYNGTVVCVASGPSASKHFAEIREKRSILCVVCADSIYSGLIENGITPDFVCMLERDPLLAPMIIPTIPPFSRVPDSWLVVPVVAWPEAVKPWSGRRIWYWQDSQGLCEWIAPNIPVSGTGRSAGTMAAAVATRLGNGNVYLIGHDLCRMDGESHAGPAHGIAKMSMAASHSQPLHAPMIVDNRESCKFWELCRRDLSVLAEENNGRVRILGRDGLDIPGINRSDAMDLGASFTPLYMNVSQSRPPVRNTIPEDAKSWAKTSLLVEAMVSNGDIQGAIAAVHPRKWANPNMVGLYSYVLGPIFRAASLRAHMRHKEPDCCVNGFRILIRTIPAMLRRMIAESVMDSDPEDEVCSVCGMPFCECHDD
jgi:hypothetical protein